jgi:hypothetical protein
VDSVGEGVDGRLEAGCDCLEAGRDLRGWWRRRMRMRMRRKACLWWWWWWGEVQGGEEGLLLRG